MASEKLKPCPVPWCRNRNPSVISFRGSYWVRCGAQECCIGPYTDSESEAIAVWNTRPAGTAGEEA